VARALVGYATGCALAVAGVFVEWGAGPALMVAGAVCAASCLLLADVEGGR
jgi:hypothetical protein